MSFLWVEMLWLLLFVPLLVGAYIIVQRRRKKYSLRYASLSLVKEALGRGPGIRRHIPPILFLIGVATMIFALARPAATVILPSQQGTVILAIDVSGSMRAEDLKPTRLEAAKSAARGFVEKQPKNVRIGVVSFADSAAIVQAPTTDREQVLAAINRLTTQRATAIGRGILTSLEAILEQPDEKPTPTPTSRDFILGRPEATPTPKPVPAGTYKSSVIVLLSDGVNTIGPLPLDIIKQMGDGGIRIYTVGVGSTSGTVLTFDGRSIRVRLDEETLKNIAEKTDAEYYKADSETDLREIYEKLSTELVLKPEETELTAGFTAVATVLLLIAGALSLLWFNRLP